MRRAGTVAVCIVAGAVLYLLFWPVPIEPVAWQAPENPGLVDPFAPNDRLAAAGTIDLGQYAGPEDAAFGHDGALYITAEGGLVLRLDRRGIVSEFADVGGRPLGIEAAADGSLIVANAYVGLQRIARDGSVTTLLRVVDGRELTYPDDVALAADGTIYFSEASTKFSAKDSGGTYEGSLLDIFEHGGHGQVIEYRPAERSARVIISDLNFPNGVAVSDDQDFLLVAETGSYRVLRHWLQGPRAGQTEVLLDNLPGFPDNINIGLNDRFWIGLAAPRNSLIDSLSDKPLLRKIVQRFPAALRPSAASSSHVFAIDGDGNVLIDLQETVPRISMLTGVVEMTDTLYLTTLFGHQLGVLSKRDL